MKTLGIIGGMSWISTQTYYRLVNERVAKALGGQHSAELLIASVDFQPIVDAQARGDWAFAGEILAARAKSLELAGAGVVLIASNTMHIVSAAVRSVVGIPLLDIFDVTAAAVRTQGVRRVGLLGTRYTMSHRFFREAYAQRGVEIVVPAGRDADLVNGIIFRDLIHGVVTPKSVAVYRDVMSRLQDRGADGIILGCTEISLLVGPDDASVPVFDTTALHADAGAAWLLKGYEQTTPRG